MSMVSDGAKQAAASRAGSEGSLEALLTPLLDAAYGTALRLTRNGPEAEDLVQEAAVQACRGFHTFEQGTNFRAWFFRVLTNCFYSSYRRTRREGTPVELEDTPELYLFSQTAATGLHARTEDPAGVLMDRLDADAVNRAIEALPEEYRVVSVLYFLQDCSYQEIAQMLVVPVGTVRSRLHRGRRLLQKRLWSIAEERGIVAALQRKGAEDE